jgi:hypothetical protein
MPTQRLRTAVLAVTCCVSISSSVVADPPKPSRVSVQASALGQIEDDQPGPVAQELDAIKVLAKKLDQRIRRVEVMVEHDRAVRTRTEALNCWRELQNRRGTVADFSAKDSQLRARYFETRAETDRILNQLNELYK